VDTDLRAAAHLRVGADTDLPARLLRVAADTDLPAVVAVGTAGLRRGRLRVAVGTAGLRVADLRAVAGTAVLRVADLRAVVGTEARLLPATDLRVVAILRKASGLRVEGSRRRADR
jgi:hypothetical protein